MAEVNINTLKRAVKSGDLNLSNKSLTKVPDVIFGIYDMKFDDISFREKTTIIKINLSSNQIKDIDPKINTFLGLKEINLMENKISSVPKELFGISTLKLINLSHNNLTSLNEEDMKEMPNLKTFSISHNKLTAIPKCFSSFSEIVELDFSHNALTELINFNLPQLTRLDLSHNKIQTIPEKFFSSNPHLESVNLTRNKLQSIPESSELHLCSKLQSFIADENSITDIFGDFSNSSIVHLSLSSNCLANFSDAILTMKSLKELFLKSNKISVIPEDISKLSNLNIINIQTNNIKKIPPQIALIPTLKNLLATGNLIRTIPQSKLEAGDVSLINHLKVQLENDSSSGAGESSQHHSSSDKKIDLVTDGNLVLQKKNLTEFDPASIKNPDHIKKIDLSSNPIKEMADFSSLGSLTTLIISHSKLSSIHPSVGNIPKLEELDLSANSIKSVDIPNANRLKILSLSYNTGINIVSLPTQLEVIKLENCQFTTIPLILFDFKKLKNLSLARNKIAEFPIQKLEEENWRSLDVLDIGYNEFRKLPPQLSYLPLSGIVIEGNPLVVPSKAVCSKGTEAILTYLKGALESEKK